MSVAGINVFVYAAPSTMIEKFDMVVGSAKVVVKHGSTRVAVNVFVAAGLEG